MTTNLLQRFGGARLIVAVYTAILKDPDATIDQKLEAAAKLTQFVKPGNNANGSPQNLKHKKKIKNINKDLLG
jgi:hypothetical protein